jgi:hypothetical protein
MLLRTVQKVQAVTEQACAYYINRVCLVHTVTYYKKQCIYVCVHT